MKRLICYSTLASVLVVLAGCVLPPGVAISFDYGPWSTPENLGTIVNSQSNDQHPAISPDGLSLYFHSDRTGNVAGSTTGTTDIWVSHRDSSQSAWGAPVNLGPTVNSITNDTAPVISTDGHYLYFGSDRPGGCGLRDIWVSHRTSTSVDIGEGGWESPVNMGCTINSAQNDDGPTYFLDPATIQVTLYWCTQNRAGGLGDWDVWKSDFKPDGTWTPAVDVTELNSVARDTRTTIRRDGLEMLVTSMRTGSVPDSSNAPSLDLWVSTRAKVQDPWGSLTDLTALNTAYGDGAPSLSSDGTELYFYSNKTGGAGTTDLYVSHRNRTLVLPPGLIH